MIHSKTLFLAGARRSTSACASTPHWRCHPCSVWMMYVLIFLLFLEGDHLHIYVYTYIHVDLQKNPTFQSSPPRILGVDVCFFCALSKKKMMNLKVGEKHGGPKNLRARFLDQIWGKRFFPKDMPGSSVTKRGSNHWKAGPGWILGKVVENIRIQCVFILYIYMYNIYVCIYIYTHTYIIWLFSIWRRVKLTWMRLQLD